MEAKELKAVFHSLLHSLPEPYRYALVLTEFEGLSQQQLARRLGISLSGAKSRVQRAREQLKELLIDYCHQEFRRAVGSQPCPKGLMPVVQDSGFNRNGKPDLSRKRSKR
jgi:RNA polymerase sigma-70 factor (ECF subfamily)